MEFYLDVDGVILDFEGSFIDFVRNHYLPDLPLNYQLRNWEMMNEFKSLDIEEVWTRFVNSERFAKMNLLVDAESFNQLSEKHPVYLLTNLHTAQYESRVKNLEMHNLKFKKLELAGHFDFGIEGYPAKSDMIAQLRNDNEKIVFLDDHPKNCIDVKERFPDSDVYLMNRPHNETTEDQRWIRVKNWREFIDKTR